MRPRLHDRAKLDRAEAAWKVDRHGRDEQNRRQRNNFLIG
jgi:hypothetical protein